MKQVLINFEISGGYIQVIKEFKKGGQVYYQLINMVEGYSYIDDNYDKIWDDFMVIIQSMNYRIKR